MPIRRSVRRRPVASDALETRCLLSTITVTSLADNTDSDGEVTLREAIQAANTDTAVDGSVAGDGADRIEFAPELAGGTIKLTNGPFEVSESVVIRSPNQRVTIDAEGAPRILNVTDASQSVVLSWLQFVGATDYV